MTIRTLRRPARIPSGALIVLALAIIFGCSLALRLYGINFGLPYVEEVDESAIMDPALAILQRGDLNPHWFTFPSLYIYLQSFVTFFYYQWAHAQGLYSNLNQLSSVFYDFRYIPQPDLYIWARTLAAIIGASTTLVLYGAASRLYSRGVGLAAAAILGATYLHLQYSHYIRVEIPLAFFATWTLFFSAQILKKGRIRDYVWAGIAIGLTTASKQTGFLIAVTVAAAHLARLNAQASNNLRGLLNPSRHWPLVLSAAVSLAAFAFVSPFSLLEFSSFQGTLSANVDYYHFNALSTATAAHYLGYFLQRGGFGEILTPLALAGLAFSLIRHRREDWLVAAFPLVYFAFLTSWNLTFIREAIILTPFLAVYAALALVQASEFVATRVPRLPWLRWALPAALLLALLLSPVQRALTEDANMAQPTTRALATDWANKNLPAGARVSSEAGGIHLIPPLVQVASGSIKALDVATFQGRQLDYFVAVDAQGDNAPRTFDSSLSLLQSFTPSSPSGGPTIRIYQVPPRPLPLELLDSHFDRDRYIPGQAVTMTLHWRVREQLGESYEEFIRLVGPEGATLFETAEPPTNGVGDTKAWAAGSIIADAHSFSLPAALPTDRYHVEIGMYRQGTNFALPLLGSGAKIVDALPIGTLKLVPASAPSATEAPPRKLSATFGGAIHLLGFGTQPPEAHGGGVIQVTLYWSAAAELEENYTRFVHLEDQAGHVIAQQDGAPDEGHYPTSIWEPTTPVADRVQLAIPPDAPPGQYALIVGWYKYPSMQRLQTDTAGDSVLLTNYELK